jgi:hypothetical protein
MHSPNAEIAATLMGADEVRVFYDQVFVKEPNTVEMTDWHHDLPFWPMRGHCRPEAWFYRAIPMSCRWLAKTGPLILSN